MLSPDENSTSTSLKSRFSDWVIPQLQTSNCFGVDCHVVSFEADPDRAGEDQFTSTVQFFRLKVQENDILRTINVLVKFQPENEVLRKSLRAKNQFYNEILMYSEIFPIIDKDGIIADIFPKYYYGTADLDLDDDSDFIVLEDLSKNYRLSSEKVFLDYDHCILAMKNIGRFHGLSYIAKKHNASKFHEVVKKIREKWDNDRLQDKKHLLALCGQRGVLPILNESQNTEFLTNFLKNYDDPVKFYSSLVEPIEPEAVLCHGDFCRNNMLFSYDDTDKPVSVKFFDLQTPRYTSPVIDLSFFLLMNTSQETRNKYWDDFLNTYKQSVKLTAPDVDIPELDFGRVAIYGYLHCSFFLPVMMRDSDTHKKAMDEILRLTPYEEGLCFSQMGDHNETLALVHVVQFLLDRKYINETYY